MQAGPAVIAGCRLRVRAGGEQGCHYGNAATLRRAQQRRIALGITRLDIGAALELVARLDVPQDDEPARGGTSVIYLKSVVAEDLAETLREFLKGSEPEIEITAHAPSNSLLVRARGQDWRELAALIDHLDKPKKK